MIPSRTRTARTWPAFPRTRGDDPERAKLTREAGRALIERWRELKTRELGLLRELADLNIDPGARREYLIARENESHRLQGRAAREFLDAEKRRIDETPVATGDTLLANTRAIGHVTVESRESYIRRKMAENGWDRQTAIAQATHLYPEEMDDLRAPWANRQLYTGEGGHSPDTAAQALYDDGRIADPTVDAFWDAVRGDIEVVSKAKRRDIDAAEAEAAAALAWGKERHDQTLAAIEMQDDAVGLGMGEARSSIGGARTTNHVGNDVLTTLEDLDVGKDVFFDPKGRGRLRVTLGQDGPGGFGIMHIVEGRMLKDGQDLDGAIRTVLRVVEAATHGKFLRHKQGRDNYGKDGAIAVIAYEKDKADGTPGKGDFVLTGYEEFTSEAERKRADARAAALRRAGRYALPPHARSEEVVTALHRIIANLQNARKSDSARSSIGGLFTSSPALYDKPSLRAIGSGLGTRVFGWGLYASDNRGMVERVYSKLLRENLDDDARPSILEQVWWDNRPEDDKTHLLPYFDVITGETRKFVNEAIEGIASDYALDDDAVLRYFGEDWQTRDMTGQEFYDLVTQVIGENLFSLDIDPEQAASQALAYYDIDGIVYPVGVDRVEAGYEGNNYVAFSDEHLRVVRRWVWNEETETFELDRSFTPPPPTMAEARATAGDDQAIAEAQASRSSIIGRIGARRLDWAGYRLTEDEHGTRRLVQGQDGRTLLEGVRDADAEVKARVGTDFTRGERARATRLSRSGPIRRDQVALAERWHRHEIQHLIQHIEGFEGGEGRKVPTWSFYANAMGEAEARVAGASAMTPYGYEMDAYFHHALELTEGEIRDETGTWRRQTYDDLTFKAQRDKILRGQDDATQGILNQFTNAKTLEALAKLAKKHLDVTAMTWGPKEGGGFEVTVEYDDDVIWWNTYASETGALNSMRRIFLNRYANRTGEARSSIGGFGLSERARAEMDEVRRQYEGTDQWMKAPNGQSTKLTRRQWLLVRTPAFKRWFGDWENDSENACKVVDENGEPLVVYHGSENAGFTVFDSDYWDEGMLGNFASSGWDVASTYSGVGIFKGDPDIVLPVRGPALSSEEEADLRPGNYALFLNIRNPLIVDAQGHNWNDIPAEGKDDYVKAIDLTDEQLLSLKEDAWPPIDIELEYDEDGNLEGWSHLELAEAIEASYVQEELDEDENVIGTDTPLFHKETLETTTANQLIQSTRDIANWALRDGSGWDGVIFRNVIDMGQYSGGWLRRESDVFVTKEGVQLKSAVRNTGNFDPENPDIRSSITGALPTVKRSRGLSNERSTKTIRSIIPFAGNKTAIVNKHQRFFAELAEFARASGGRIVDAFAGIGGYTSSIGRGTELPEGSALNEWSIARYTMHKAIAEDPEAVSDAARDIIGRLAESEEVAAFREALKEAHKEKDDAQKRAYKRVALDPIVAWFNDELNGRHGVTYVVAPGNSSYGDAQLNEDAQTAALYVILQTLSTQSRPINFIWDDKTGTAKIDVAGKKFDRSALWTNAVREDYTPQWRYFLPEKYTDKIGELGKIYTRAKLTVTRRDGWEVAREAKPGDVVFVDPAYLGVQAYGGSKDSKTSIDANNVQEAIQKLADLAKTAIANGFSIVYTNEFTDKSKKKKPGFSQIQYARIWNEAMRRIGRENASIAYVSREKGEGSADIVIVAGEARKVLDRAKKRVRRDENSRTQDDGRNSVQTPRTDVSASDTTTIAYPPEEVNTENTPRTDIGGRETLRLPRETEAEVQDPRSALGSIERGAQAASLYFGRKPTYRDLNAKSLAEVALFATGKKQTRQKVAEAYASFGVSVTPETAAVIADRINADLEEQRNARRSRLKPGEQPRDRAFGLVDALAKAYDTNWAEAQKEAFSKGVAGTFGAAREMAEDIQTLMEARRQEAEAATGTAPAVLETEMGFDIEATLMAAPEPSPRATGRRRRSPRRFTRTPRSCATTRTSRTAIRKCGSCATHRRLSLAGRIGRGDGMDSEKTSEQRGHRVYSLELLELEEARQRSANTASTALPRARGLTGTIANPGRGSQPRNSSVRGSLGT